MTRVARRLSIALLLLGACGKDKTTALDIELAKAMNTIAAQLGV